MFNTMRCTECSAWVTLPYAKSVNTVSCQRCGTTYFCNMDGPPRKFYPALSMHPIDVQGVASIWMPTHTRPVKPGDYECRFRNTEPNILLLRWNGAAFVVPETGERVQMIHFLSWRGALA